MTLQDKIKEPDALTGRRAFTPSKPRQKTDARAEIQHTKNAMYLRCGLNGYIPDAWIIAPSQPAQAPPVVCVHGISREAEAMARALAGAAEACGRTVIVPSFDAFGYRQYQRALCKNRSDQALLRLMETLHQEDVVSSKVFDLCGFSGGAQFAHRFAWFYPQRVGRLVLSSAGWYTFPDAAPFPYGMGGGMAGNVDTGFCLRTNLPAFLDRDIVIRVGANDNLVDKNTRQGDVINAQQGRDRVSRARTWSAALKKAAEAFGIEPSIDLQLLEHCGHDFEDCVRIGGLDRVFVNGTGDIRA